MEKLVTQELKEIQKLLDHAANLVYALIGDDDKEEVEIKEDNGVGLFRNDFQQMPIWTEHIKPGNIIRCIDDDQWIYVDEVVFTDVFYRSGTPTKDYRIKVNGFEYDLHKQVHSENKYSSRSYHPKVTAFVKLLRYPLNGKVIELNEWDAKE